MSKRDFDKLPLVVGGKTVIFPCLEILALSTVPKADGAQGYARFYSAFERAFGDQVTHFRLSDSTKWKKFQAKDRGKVSGWFSDELSLAAPMLGISMHSHAVGNEPQVPAFRMMFNHAFEDNPQGMFQICLPLESVGEDAASILQLIDDAMADFPVHWGTAGYSFYWEDTDTTIDDYANQWNGRHLAKHPGLAPGNPLQWAARGERGLANIGWLTFLGDGLIEELGGLDDLTTAVETAGLGLRRYGKGVALQAGPVPELGNVNRKQTLSAYAAVGQIVESIFAPTDVLEEIDLKGYDDDDEMLEWLRRFLP